LYKPSGATDPLKSKEASLRRLASRVVGCGADGTRTRKEAHIPAVLGSNEHSHKPTTLGVDESKSAFVDGMNETAERVQNGVTLTDTPPHSLNAVSPSDVVTERLTLAIDRASESGQWTVVERLAEQLERHQLRQLEAQADNVARLRPLKKDGGSR
jgi:hypothetical protein